jgi:hypothetical protein
MMTRKILQALLKISSVNLQNIISYFFLEAEAANKSLHSDEDTETRNILLPESISPSNSIKRPLNLDTNKSVRAMPTIKSMFSS